MMDTRKELFEVERSVLEKILKLFDRNAKSLNEDIETLKSWMKKQPHLPEVMDDKMIENFLILNKCSVEKCKPKIDMYYTVRTLLGDIFKNSNPKSLTLKQLQKATFMVPLPKLTDEMYRVFLAKTRNKIEMDDVDVYAPLCYVMNLQEIRMREDVAFGDIFIFDCENASSKFMKQITPVVIYNIFVRVYQKVFSSRMKQIYVLNAPPVVETMLGIFKSMVKAKMSERIHVLQHPDELKQIFPTKILPKEYGGEEKSLEELQEIVVSKFDEYQKRFDQLDELRTDESLRPQKLENSEYLGFHGNFKKLEVD